MNQIIHNFLMGLNNVGWGFCKYALRMFVQSGVLIIMLIIIDFMLRNKVRAVFRYCLWMLVFVKLILPPTLSLPTGIGYWCGDSLSTEYIISRPIVDITSAYKSIRSDIFEHSVTSTEPSQALPSQVPSETAVGVPPVMSEMSEDSAAIAGPSQTRPYQVPSEAAAVVIPVISEMDEDSAAIAEPSQDQSSQPLPVTSAIFESILTALAIISWQAVVFLLWLVGIFVFSILLIQRMLSVLGLITQSEPAKGQLLETFNQCRKRVGIGRNVGLRLSSHVQSPAVCGLFKPIILMPTSLPEELSKDRLKAVLIHELVHIKRCDLWINFVQTFLQIIYFYNPFVWFANAVVRRLREQAVDESVLVALGAEAKSYSNTLIDIAEMVFLKANFGLRLIGVAESKRSLHRRIRHILTRPIPKNARVGVFGIAIIIVIAAVLLPMARAEKPAESEEHSHQDITSTVPETAVPFALRIRAFIDGSDYIKIRGDSLWYEHLKWDLPGKWWDRSENIKYDEPTYINGEAWKPEWEGRMSKPYIMKQFTLPREVNNNIRLSKISGRGSVSITGTPKPENDYTLSILLDDNLYNKAQWYEVVIQSGPGDTAKESVKDDTISSSTESILQIPAANELPGTLIFQGQYKHLSRGSDYGQPSVLWLKRTPDRRITAVAHMPFRKATIIASGDQENRFTHYKIEQSALGDRPEYLMDLKLLDNKVLLTRRGIRQDVDDEELRVPEGAFFNPNTRPDTYCAANILLRGFNLEKGQSKEFHVYDWDNTGEAFADYTIRVEYTGIESVDVPAGRFEANHFVLTQVTSANTWFKKRAGHVTDFWVLDNGVIVRVLRHREPYEIQLLRYTVPNKLPGHLSAATTPVSKKRITSTDGQAKAETTGTVPSPREEVKVLAFDDFDDSLSLDWEILHDDPTHYSLTKKPGSLTITTQKGGFAWRSTDYDNLFLIDFPALLSSGVQITTCISGFKPKETWQQAGLIFYNDDDNYLKWVCAWEVEGQRGFTFLAESDAFRESHWGFVGHQDLEKFWLRVMKRGNRYEFFISYDGKSFERFEIPTSGHGTQLVDGTLEWGDGLVRKIGLFANNGLDSKAPKIDASFEFFEVRELSQQTLPTKVQVRPVVLSEEETLKVKVPALSHSSTGWISSGLYISKGQFLRFKAEGSIVVGPIHAMTGPNGQSSEGSRHTTPFVAEDCQQGALIGKIGDTGKPFLIGAESTREADVSGVLFLSVNDRVGMYEDNSGSFEVIIVPIAGRDVGVAPKKSPVKMESESTDVVVFHQERTGNLLVRLKGKGIKAHWGVQAYPAGEKLGIEDRIDSSGFELDHYIFRGLKEGDYVVVAPIPFEIAGVNKATVQLNGRTRATVEPGKDIRAEIDFKENAGIRGAFQCPDRNLSWRIILLDGVDKSCGFSSAEITQARALGWKLERSGFYEINYLSPGTYTIIGRICKKGENWIPFMEKKKTVTLGDREVAVVDFNFPSEPGDSQASRSPERSKEEAGKRYQSDLRAFFNEIDKTYPFFDLKNIREDWNHAKERLTVQVRKCKSDSEFMRIVLDATKCLRDSHVRIYNNSVDIPWPAPEYYPLIGFMPAQGNTVVIMMSPPGQESSLPVGTIVKTIDGVDARKYLDARAKETWEAGGHPSPQRARLFAYRIPLKGAKGTKHKIIVRRRDKEEEIVLECTKEARGWPHTYNLPGKMERVGRSFFYTKLPSGVGYMYLRRVDSSVTQGMSEAVKTHPDVRGWIVDLRGNGGGGYDSKLIQMVKNLPRPLAGLIDAGCMSAGETLARDIRRIAGARLFGSKTAGSSSSKRSWQFPSGIASVIIPTRSYWRADRKPIEYNGIEPDEKIEAVSSDLLRGLNTGILRAEKYIRSQASNMARYQKNNMEEEASIFDFEIDQKYKIPEKNLKLTEQLEDCADLLKQMYSAIANFEAEQGQLPNWLSDLVPKYLGAEDLLCPHDQTHQSRYYRDPKMPCSYTYEFCTTTSLPGLDPSKSSSTRNLKMTQLKEFGDVLPVVRCHKHEGKVLNLAVSGEIYWSSVNWERLFEPGYRFRNLTSN